MTEAIILDSEPELQEVVIGTTEYITDPYDGDEFAKNKEFRSVTKSGNYGKLDRRFSKFNTGTGAGSKKSESHDNVTGYDKFDVVLPPYNLDYLAKLYEISPPHYAAVNAKVYNIAGLGFDFVATHAARDKMEAADASKKPAMRKKMQRMKDELYDWLDGCNQEDTFVETLSKVWRDYEATGNGYLEVGRKVNGEIGYIGHIPATTMRIRKQRDGYVQVIADRVIFFKNFGDKKTKDQIGSDPRPNEIIMIKKYSPTHSYYGIPDIVAAKGAVAGNEFSTQYNLDYFQNKAVPRYLIVTKGAQLSKNAQNNILAFFETNLKGKNHRSLYVPLPAEEDNRKVSFEMKPVEAGIQESSFNNYRKANHMDILMAHRVPPTKAGLTEGVSLAAARDMDKTFKEQVTRPEQSILEKKLAKIIKEVTDVFYLKLNELSLTDEDTQSKIEERQLRMQQKTPNELRAKRGEPPLEGGDKVVVLNPKEASEQATQGNASRTRDQNRSAGATDSDGNGRNEQGAGRSAS